jgi:hypothetical protein
MEFSYRLPVSAMNALKTGITLFVRGNNLITFSEMKDLDPENPDAGVTTYPLYRTWAFGISLTL